MVLEVRQEYQYGAPYTFLLLSDLHYDHPNCQRALVHKLLDEARERNAKVLINGDLLCLMQAKSDKRHGKGAVRPEHQGDKYFDLVIQDTAEKLGKWADLLLLIGDGNHESSVVKHKEIDPLDLLAHRLNSDHGGNVHRSGYHSFVKFVFHSGGGRVRSKLMYLHHGTFGGIVTKGFLGISRHGLVIPQADVIWTGHTHTLWYGHQPRLLVRQNGETYVDDAIHVKTGTFKEEFNKPGGFAVERLATPASVGGYWMTFTVQGDGAALGLSFEVAR